MCIRDRDIMYNFPHGKEELEGIANRTDFDLGSHTKNQEDFNISSSVMRNKKSISKLAVQNLTNNKWFIPYVVEPSAGVERGVLALLNEAYTVDEKNSRIVLALKPHLSPIKAAVIPLKRNNELLVKYAKEGNRVLRLKGGDPFIFGRGGEEIDTLVDEKIAFQVVPGITAASGCAAYAGIPLTHRDHAQSCSFVTGHLKNGKLNQNWEKQIQKAHTIIFYMGLVTIDIICDQLQKHGLDKNTPCALIQQGTTPEQKEFVSTIEDMPALVKKEKPQAPTLLIVGDVVKLRDKLSWYKTNQ